MPSACRPSGRTLEERNVPSPGRARRPGALSAGKPLRILTRKRKAPEHVRLRARFALP